MCLFYRCQRHYNILRDAANPPSAPRVPDCVLDAHKRMLLRCRVDIRDVRMFDSHCTRYPRTEQFENSFKFFSNAPHIVSSL